MHVLKIRFKTTEERYKEYDYKILCRWNSCAGMSYFLLIAGLTIPMVMGQSGILAGSGRGMPADINLCDGICTQADAKTITETAKAFAWRRISRKRYQFWLKIFRL